jgi:hypothetical protein
MMENFIEPISESSGEGAVEIGQREVDKNARKYKRKS